MNKILLCCLGAFLFLLFSCIATSCNTTEPPPPKNNGALTLSLTETSCTEAWVNLKTQNISFPAQINFLLACPCGDNKALRNISLTSGDTTIYIDSLLPNKTYTLQAFIPQGGGHSSILSETKSNKLSVTTLDTTSHSFTWQTYTFGDPSAGSSSLSDVAIINENNIWAVGQIYMNDSNGNPDPLPYNAVHWDGNKGELKRITVDYKGSQITPPLYGIYAFSSDDIWLSSGVPVHGNGTNWTQYHLFDMGILTQDDGYLTKIWGSSSNDLYYVGTKGTIAHYQNGQWSKIESGTSLNIYDIRGDYDFQTNQKEILAIGSDVGTGNGSIIEKINNNSASQLSSEAIVGNATTIWFLSDRAYYVGSGKAYYKHKLNDSNWHPLIGLTRYTITSIDGNDINDVFFTSSGGDIVHFNGVSFKSYLDQIRMSQIIYSSIKTKGNLAIAVGFLDARAVITIGKRSD